MRLAFVYVPDGSFGLMAHFQQGIQIFVWPVLGSSIIWNPRKKFWQMGGYRDGGVNFVTPTGLHNIGQRMRSLCRARHETINGRIKIFKVTDTRFRHNLNKHRMCFHTVLIITQMHIMLYDTNFEVFYNEDIGMFPEET
jgi:hypothetical protein